MKTQRNMIDFLNYYLSGGSLARIMGVAGEEVERKLEGIDLEAARAYRQTLGGVITTSQQLFQLPGFSPSYWNNLLKYWAD